MKDLVFEQLTVALSGRYVPERDLGHGAMASVYLAKDLKHDRLVAIKVLRTAVEDPSAAERFTREIKFLANLSHPHILPLFDSGDALGMLYYVTAYVEGETLRGTSSSRRTAASPSARPADSFARSPTDSITRTNRTSCIAT